MSDPEIGTPQWRDSLLAAGFAPFEVERRENEWLREQLRVLTEAAEAFYANPSPFTGEALRGVLDDHPRGETEIDPTHCKACYEQSRGGSV